MVGDRLNTDIQFGKSGGVATLLVLTGARPSPSLPLIDSSYDPMIEWAGITSEDELTGPKPSPIVPDYVTASIGDLRIAV